MHGLLAWSAPEDYRFLVRFRNYATGISIVKRGADVVIEPEPSPKSEACDVTYITRLQYIKWSLSSQYGHEILFVGSGGIFEYASQAKARENVHRELAVMLVPHENPAQIEIWGPTALGLPAQTCDQKPVG